MFILLVIYSLNFVNSRSTSINKTCSSNLTKNIPQCSIISSVDILVECPIPNVIEVFPSYSAFSANLTCSSSYNLDATVTFEDGIPSSIYCRIESYIDGLKSGKTTYHLQLQFDFQAGKKSGAIYRIFSVVNKELQAIIIVRARKSSHTIGNSFWTTNSLKSETDEEVITIPCHPLLHDVKNSLLKFDDDKYDPQFPIHPYIPIFDNSSVTFDFGKGYILNSTSFSLLNSQNLSGKYRCGDVFRVIAISLPPEFSVFPNSDMISLPLGDGVNSLLLTCTSLQPIKLIRSVNSETLVSQINVTSNYVVQKPIKQYTVTYINNSVPLWERDTISCVNAKTNKVLHTWKINEILVKKLVIVEDPWSPSSWIPNSPKELKCYPPDITIEVPEDGQKVKLFTLYCTSIFQCKLLETCIDLYFSTQTTIPNKDGKDEASVGHFHQDKIICSVKIFQGSTCLHFSDDTLVNRCETITAFEKGIAKCFNSDVRINESVSAMYFVGFNGNLYTEKDFDKVPTDAIFKVEGPPSSELYTFNQVTFKCQVHSFFSGGLLYWDLELRNKSHSLNALQKTEQFRDSKTRNPVMLIKLTFFDTNVLGIKCSAQLTNGTEVNEWIEGTYPIEITESVIPVINNVEKSTLFHEHAIDQSLTCKTSGYPIPKLKWLREGEKIEPPLLILSNVISSVLQFPKYDKSFEGDYTCISTNVAGHTSHTFHVSTAISNKFGLISIIFLTLFLILVAVVAILVFLYFRLRKSKNNIRLSDEDIKKFKDGLNEMDDCENTDRTAANNMPYNNQYEISKDDILIDKSKILGSGAFGVVYKGNIKMFETDIAVKVTKTDCSLDLFKSLLSELKILIYVGKHENIIKLIGANTEELQNGKLYIALELCALGSLESYLRKNKHLFNGDEQYTNVNYLGHPTLLKWCAQIAHGMDYLASKNVIHSDLATRNVLITSEHVMKITDFGLSRRMYNYCNYVKSSKDPLPWRWMALESLKSMTFSTQSDVWSFGITLWEIFSLGNVPYPGISYTVEFYQMLDQGTRNPKPSHANSQIYHVMLSCWQKNPDDRPSFDNLRKFFLEKLDHVDTNFDTPGGINGDGNTEKELYLQI